MKQIYLLRHGQCQANADKVVCSFTDSPLTDLGKQQAKDAGQYAKRNDLKIDLIAHSPLSRAADTAKIIAKELTPLPTLVEIDGLRERNLGTEEGKSYANSAASDEPREAVPDMESTKSLYNRAKKVFDELKERPEENILISCHNGIGRMFKVIARGGDHSELSNESRLENAIIYKLWS